MTGLYYVINCADSRRSSLIDLTQDKIAIFGHIMAKNWPNICLITILRKDNFTSQFYVKKGWQFQIKECYWLHSRQNSHFWPYYGQIWPIISLIIIIIFGEDNFTKQFYVKKGWRFQKKTVLLTPFKTQWPFLAILWPKLAKYRPTFNYNFGRL